MAQTRRRYRTASTSIDQFIKAYLELAPIERPLAMAALRGAELTLGREARGNGKDIPPETQAAFEDVGAAIAAEAVGE